MRWIIEASVIMTVNNVFCLFYLRIIENNCLVSRPDLWEGARFVGGGFSPSHKSGLDTRLSPSKRTNCSVTFDPRKGKEGAGEGLDDLIT